MKSASIRLIICGICVFLLYRPAFAAPEIAFLKVTDVTTSSLSLVWMTNTSGDPSVQVFTDRETTNDITNKLSMSIMPSGNKGPADAARAKGIVKVRISGLTASTAYFVRAVMKEAESPYQTGLSRLIEVRTASKTIPYEMAGGQAAALSNDLAAFKVYVRPFYSGTAPGIGDLVILETENSAWPVSAFAGDGAAAPDGLLDLNNLFSENRISLGLSGGEKIVITVYRGGMLSTLTHYRRVPSNSGMVYVSEPEKGFFADFNLDRRVDLEDFESFRSHYRTASDDEIYNPDFDIVEDISKIVDAKDFSRFSRQYGRTDAD